MVDLNNRAIGSNTNIVLVGGGQPIRETVAGNNIDESTKPAEPLVDIITPSEILK